VSSATGRRIKIDSSVFEVCAFRRWLWARGSRYLSVSLKLVKHGGLLATRDVASVAEAAGIGLYGGCLLESSIGAAAHLQVFAGLRELAWGCEHFGPQILVDDLVEERCASQISGFTCRRGPASGSRSTRTSYAATRDPVLKPVSHPDQSDGFRGTERVDGRIILGEQVVSEHIRDGGNIVIKLAGAAGSSKFTVKI
jgi:hypothetical protein